MNMINVCFVCLGNICRSPIAEAVFKRICSERGMMRISVISRGTSACSEGSPVYPPAARVLSERGYEFTHTAMKISISDIEKSDFIMTMDTGNYYDAISIAGEGNAQKVRKMSEFTPGGVDIADPWYTRDFERTYREIYTACREFASFLIKNHPGDV